MAGTFAAVAFLSCFVIVIHAEDDTGLHRESKFLKLGSKGECFAGLNDIDVKLDSAEAKLLKVIEIFRMLMMKLSTLPKPGNGDCEGGGSGNFTFAPDNSATLDNSNNINNTDYFLYNNYEETRTDDGGTGGITTAGPGATTTPSGMMTTTPTTSTGCASNCYDVIQFLNGRALTDVFTSYTTIMRNTAEKCAAFCILWGFSTAVISNGVVCHCTDEVLSDDFCLPNVDPLGVPIPSQCNSPCPGGGDPLFSCGALLNILFVSVYEIGIDITLSNTEVQDLWPSGKCFGPFNPLTLIPDLIVDDPMKALIMTPSLCAAECAAFGWSCIYAGAICGCYLPERGPSIVSPFQDYCANPCPGDILGFPEIHCGSLAPSIVPAASCKKFLPTKRKSYGSTRKSQRPQKYRG